MFNPRQHSFSKSFISIFLIFAIALSGCSHDLTIKNIETYENIDLTPLERSLTIGIIPKGNDIYSEKLIKAISRELRSYDANVVNPYSEHSIKPVDVKAYVSVKSRYEGSGWNFLVNFPGFLVWAPAWHGYVYEVTYDVNIKLVDTRTNMEVGRISQPIVLNIRHADINRTWTEISWFEFGIIALIGGVVFIQYDDSVSPLVSRQSRVTLGDYISQEIINKLNASGYYPAAPEVE